MLTPGTQIGTYRVESVLGRGGMGVVYEATQLSLGRTVALKLLDAALSEDESFQERFRMEGRVQARLDHPNIIPVYEAGELPEGLFIAMRLVDGPNLKQLVRAGELDPGRILRLLEPVADALDTAHEAGLTHRDVKPQNILVDRRDHAYLADFGITKPAGSAGLTRSGYVMGTLDYLSPEQIRGEKATALSDVYAFAAMAYECLSGRVPFPKESEAAVMFAHVSEAPPRAGLGQAVDDVLANGMAKEPGERPASATALMHGLREALGDPRPARTPTDGVAAWPPPPPPPAEGVPTASVELRGQSTRMDPLREPEPEPEPVEPRGPKRGLLAGAGVLAAAAGVALGLVLSGGDAPPPKPERVSSGPIAFTAPAGWAEAAEPVEISGLKLEAPVAVQAPKQGAVVAGFTTGTGATLLPEDFRKRLKDAPETGTRVQLGKLDALRFDKLTPKKGDPLRLFTALTDKGVATIACVGVAEAPVCDRMAASVELDGAEARSLDPDAKYGRRLRGVVTRLGKARDGQLKALRAARTPGAQALAAAAVGRAYASAVESLGEKIKPGPREIEAHVAMYDAFRDGAIDYVKLAQSAAKGANAWKRARKKAERADAAARRAVRGLEDLGFEVS